MTPAAPAAPEAVPALVDARCSHSICENKGVYRMIGGCYNCRLSPVLGLFTVTHETSSDTPCPVCGARHMHWDRLATPDEIPADFEAKQ